MALDYCSECGSVEGGWRLASGKELADIYGVSYLTDHDVVDHWDNKVCEQCGAIGARTGIPEHDEMDWER